MNLSKPRVLVSFSGGETSGYMARRMQLEYADRFEMIFVFANTGEENEETLLFVKRCDDAFGLNVVWLEAAVSGARRVGTTYRRVDFEQASRRGEPYEAVIRKYGIPNKAYPHCTRELKLAPMTAYARSLGWRKGMYRSAVGIRADEPKRIRRSEDVLYPLVTLFPSDKQDVNCFWEDQPFRLMLAGYQGNCKWCWKKSTQKLITIAKENRAAFDFPLRMEAEHGLAGHNVDGTRRVFFRQNMSAKHLLTLADGAEPRVAAPLDADTDDGCSESCDIGDLL